MFKSTAPSYRALTLMLATFFMVSYGLFAQVTQKVRSATSFSVGCGKPTGLQVTNIGTNTARLQWTAVSGAVFYNVQYKITGISSWTTASSTSANLNLTGLSAATAYEFRVQTKCSSGLGVYSSPKPFSTLSTACSVPDVNLFSSTNITSTSCTVGWVAVSGAVSYTVQYRVRYSGSSWDAMASSGNSCTITSLLPVTLYEFQVKTNCASSGSAFSASGIFTTLSNPCNVPDVAYFSSTSITATSCTVGWAAISSAISYNIQFRVRNSGSAWTTVSANGNSKSLTGLSASSLYEFQVQTVCSGGMSAYSSPGIFTTLASGTSCGTPTGLNASAITSTGATLNWTAVSGALSYTIQYRRTGTTSWSSASSTTNSKTITGLSISSEYEFQVQTVCNASSGLYSSIVNFTTSGSSGASLPVPDHIVICIFENHAYQQIIGNNAAPYMTALANDVMSANFTESYGITHPSQPNYLHLFAGGNQGVTNNAMPSSHFTSMNLAAALQNAGKTFVTYSEGLPSVGYDGEASGEYVHRHNPVANWMGNGTNQVSTSTNQPYTAFPSNYSNLPTVSFVVPNLTNGMHDGTGNSAITAGDNWYHTYMEPYVQWARTHNSLFILTFDEDDSGHNNQIPTIFSGQMVAQGHYSTGINHHNILRTIEDMYGLTHSGAAASATPIHGCWNTGFRITPGAGIKDEQSISLFPNPVQDKAHLIFELSESSNIGYQLSGITGNLIYSQNLGTRSEGRQEFSIPVADLHLRNGIYFLEMQINDQRIVKRFVIAND
ncbi:MAG TPA: fibronectin type III domain-containing protein [Bacteroidia bacterium]|nr:fibronectin type III domain-containing protein [Bacteroidia bacterium]